MNTTHQANKNLTTYQGRKFNGVTLLPNQEFFSEYLQSIEELMGRALKEHKRTLMIRFDLHFPQQVDCCDFPSLYKSNVISRFFASLEAKFKADLVKKKRNNKRVHHSNMRYVWAREQRGANQPHYHVALFVNGDTYNSIGSYNHQANNNAARITQAWASALDVEMYTANTLVHFPLDRPVYYLDVNSSSFERVYGDAFKRLSYLCKQDTKHYNNSGKSFCCSRR
jgi:hypothetical protein